jgi:hypothetical protein
MIMTTSALLCALKSPNGAAALITAVLGVIVVLGLPFLIPRRNP